MTTDPIATNPPANKQTITLTGAMIRDLAEFTGFALRWPASEYELETEIVITGPGEIIDDDGKPVRFSLIAYLEDCPEEGAIGLGSPLPLEPSQ